MHIPFARSGPRKNWQGRARWRPKMRDEEIPKIHINEFREGFQISEQRRGILIQHTLHGELKWIRQGLRVYVIQEKYAAQIEFIRLTRFERKTILSAYQSMRIGLEDMPTIESRSEQFGDADVALLFDAAG